MEPICVLSVSVAMIAAAVVWPFLDHRSIPRPAARTATATASAVATRFAVAWWSQAGEDPRRRLERLAPLVAPDLLATLSAGPPAPALEDAERTQRRRVEVGAPSVTVADRSPAGVGLAVTAPVTVTTADGPEVMTTWATELLAVLRDGHWSIARIDQ